MSCRRFTSFKRVPTGKLPNSEMRLKKETNNIFPCLIKEVQSSLTMNRGEVVLGQPLENVGSGRVLGRLQRDELTDAGN